MSSATSGFHFQIIGIIHSCFREKFGIPRQPGLARTAKAELELLEPYNRPEALVGLEAFSHLWVHFVFHQTMADGWRPTVRPPRLGGEQRIGVFASRSTHRPNPLGLSVVRLDKVVRNGNSLKLELSGADLLDGTPVLDIKPYLPWADSVADASCGFAPEPLPEIEIRFTEQALKDCRQYQQLSGHNIEQLAIEVLSQDPRPAYLRRRERSEYGIRLWDTNLRWRILEDCFEVYEVTVEH